MFSMTTLLQGDLLIAPESQDWALNLLTAASTEIIDFTQKVESAANRDAGDFWTQYEGTPFASLRPYNVQGGVLTIPVRGMLTRDFPFTLGNTLTGYEYIVRAVERGINDPAVTQIAMDVHSPGGLVAGCFDCADAVYEMARASGKETVAYANEHAFSAAYAVASAADKIVVARTGSVGSVGVIATHVEMSANLEQRGLKVTLVAAGAQKAEGHPAFPLSEAAKARIQERVDAHYQIFVSTVARNRDMEEDAVRATEAGVFLPEKAVEIGLADAVGPLGSLSAVADPSDDNEEIEMTDVTQADHDAAVAQATDNGKATGAAEERARISGIMGLEEAKTRPAATALMVDLGLSVEDSKTRLAKLPEETKAEAPEGDTSADTSSSFLNGMTHTPNPDVGPDSKNGEGDKMSTVDRIFASAGFGPAK